MGLYRRPDSRFWWISNTTGAGCTFEPTRATGKEVAKKRFERRQAEIALSLFKVGLPGMKMKFAELCREYSVSHSSLLSASSRDLNVR